MRCHWWLVGLRPSLRQSSLPVAGSCAVTMSPPETTISVRLLTFSGTGVVYASGASAMALVGRSCFQTVFPVALSMRRR